MEAIASIDEALGAVSQPTASRQQWRLHRGQPNSPAACRLETH